VSETRDQFLVIQKDWRARKTQGQEKWKAFIDAKALMSESKKQFFVIQKEWKARKEQADEKWKAIIDARKKLDNIEAYSKRLQKAIIQSVHGNHYRGTILRKMRAIVSTANNRNGVGMALVAATVMGAGTAMVLR
jgi:hypothetical protein